MTGAGALGAVAALAGLLVLVSFVVRALRAESQQRDWLPARATIIEAKPWVGSRADAPHGSYRVRARLVTREGREVDAWADGAYAGADRWIGSTRPAWHHPARLDCFRLVEPRGAAVGLLHLLPAVLIVALVLAVFGGVALMALR